jgi:adenylate cyclase
VSESLLDIGLIIFMGVATSIISWKLRHLVSLPLVATLVALHAALASWAYLSGRWISVVYPVTSILLVSALVSYLRFFIVDRHAREVRAMFSSYVTQRLVDEMIKNPEMARLGGEKRDITVLFSDIRNFTAYSENHKPEEVVAILNEYLDGMTDIILKWEGILDKFIGDAIVVFWGAPLKQEDHAERAVKCALEMQKRLEALQKIWIANGREPLFSAIGINTGEAIVGNIGSEGRKMDYTVIGDNVNLGARVEGLNRRYDTSILLTEHTVARLRSSIADGSFRGASITGIERVTVKGKETPVGIYSVAAVDTGQMTTLVDCDPEKVVRLVEK